MCSPNRSGNPAGFAYKKSFTADILRAKSMLLAATSVTLGMDVHRQGPTMNGMALAA
jgi:hypothetical protein